MPWQSPWEMQRQPVRHVQVKLWSLNMMLYILFIKNNSAHFFEYAGVGFVSPSLCLSELQAT